MPRGIQLNVDNFEKMRQRPAESFEVIRFDPNNDCNLHCVYCGVPRSKSVVEAEVLRRFLTENVISVNEFQIGCRMEPTLDPRLGDLVLIIAGSRAKPKNRFVLQTNGTMLKMHDPAKFNAAGLTDLMVSVDSADPAIHKSLRGGTSLSKVRENLQWFHIACPSVRMSFITTVTTENIGGMEDLVSFGISLGVARFVLREMFYFPSSKIVDHSRMPGLVTPQGAFAGMKEAVSAKFGEQVSLHFFDASTLVDSAKQIRRESYLPAPPARYELNTVE